MGLNDTANANRIHISFFGNRNVGKSSLVNAVTGQELSVVSDVLGTTTDPVKKAMELLPLGPVLIIDTPGFDDVGQLGSLRVKKTKEILNKTDIAVLVSVAGREFDQNELDFLSIVKEKKIPFIIAKNKCDLTGVTSISENEIYVSAEKGININELKEKIGALAKMRDTERPIISDKLQKGDRVVLVTPIDESAPKGRIILPQQQTLRDILDSGCSATVCQPAELKGVLSAFKEPPRLVITDSQVFGSVSKIVPYSIPLTSFSILMARYKGSLNSQIEGFNALKNLKNGDRVLISEGCTHHRQCGDIGSVKMPRWIEEFTGVTPNYTFTSGGEFPEDLSDFKLVIHCGGCMLNETEMKHRIRTAKKQNTPVVNYGIAIAGMNGILKRSIELFEKD